MRITCLCIKALLTSKHRHHIYIIDMYLSTYFFLCKQNKPDRKYQPLSQLVWP